MDQVQQTGNVTTGDAALQTTTTAAVTPEVQTPAQTAPVVTPPAEDYQHKIDGLTQAAEAERKKRQEIENQLSQTQIALMQMANQRAVQPPQPPQPDPADPLAGYSDTDLLDPAKVREALRKVHQTAVATAQQSVAQVRFQSKYQDFDTLVGTTNQATGQFVPSELLSEAMQENPGLGEEIVDMGRSDPMAAKRYAYRMAQQQKRLRELRTKPAVQQPPVPNNVAQMAARNAQATADALTAPMSPASVSGTTAQATHSEEYWRERLKQPEGQREFESMMERARRGEFG